MNGENAPLAVDIVAVTAVILYLLVRHIIRGNKRPANTNSPRWVPGDYEPCEMAHCHLPGTNHVEWLKSGEPGNLCPGCRDSAVGYGFARDAWDDAS